MITDGEQTKSELHHLSAQGLENLAPDGAVIPFVDGHIRQLPEPIRRTVPSGKYADGYLVAAKRYAHVPVKQAVIAASALSLIYSQDGIEADPREAFLWRTWLGVRRPTSAARSKRARTACRSTSPRVVCRSSSIHPAGSATSWTEQLRALYRSDEERMRIGVHTCPGGDRDSTHSADVDYAELLPELFKTNVGNVDVELAARSYRGRCAGDHRQTPAP